MITTHNTENPVTKRLMTITQIAAELGPSTSYIGAVVIMMYGRPHPKWLDLEAVRAWILAHPDFRCHHVYGARAKESFAAPTANLPAGSVDRSGESPTTHGSPTASPHVKAPRRVPVEK